MSGRRPIFAWAGNRLAATDKPSECRDTSTTRFAPVANGQYHRRISFVAVQRDSAAAAEIDDPLAVFGLLRKSGVRGSARQHLANGSSIHFTGSNSNDRRDAAFGGQQLPQISVAGQIRDEPAFGI